jgi:hypothetical protein
VVAVLPTIVLIIAVAATTKIAIAIAIVTLKQKQKPSPENRIAQAKVKPPRHVAVRTPTVLTEITTLETVALMLEAVAIPELAIDLLVEPVLVVICVDKINRRKYKT